jgi:hypothetical protein
MHAFRERFGADAPKGWWGALQRDARNDVQWQARIEARKAEKDDAAA